MICLPRSGLPRWVSAAPARPPGDRGQRRRWRSTGSSIANRPAWCARSWRTVIRSFALLRELRPVRAHPLFVVEPAARVGDGERHRGQALGRRVDDDHGVSLPRLARLACSECRPTDRRLSRRGDRRSRRRPAPDVELKFSTNASRTASKPRLTCPSTVARSAVAIDITPPTR